MKTFIASRHPCRNWSPSLSATSMWGFVSPWGASSRMSAPRSPMSWCRGMIQGLIASGTGICGDHSSSSCSSLFSSTVHLPQLRQHSIGNHHCFKCHRSSGDKIQHCSIVRQDVILAMFFNFALLYVPSLLELTDPKDT